MIQLVYASIFLLFMSQKEANKIHSNIFLDVLALILSFFVSIIRSISYLF